MGSGRDPLEQRKLRAPKPSGTLDLRRSAQGLKALLDPSVLQRVKADARQTPAGAKAARRLREQRIELGQLCIDVNP